MKRIAISIILALSVLGAPLAAPAAEPDKTAEDENTLTLVCLSVYGEIAGTSSGPKAEAARDARLELIDYYRMMNLTSATIDADVADSDAVVKEMLAAGSLTIAVMLPDCNGYFDFKVEE